MGRSKCIITDKGRECTKCGEYKLYKDYYYIKATGRYTPRCKKCQNKVMVEGGYLNKYANSDKGKASLHKYYLKNKEAFYKRSAKSLDKMKAGVYLITTGAGRYVGQSKHIKLRLYQHRGEYSVCAGKDIQKFEVLEYIEDLDKRLVREQYWIDKLKPELNTEGVGKE